MKEYLNQFSRFMLIFTMAALLQACGGSSSDKLEKYTISANTTSIDFSNEFLQVSDDTVQVDISFNGKGLLVGFAPDSQPVGWLNFRTENVTNNSATLIVNVVNAENIIADLYQTKLRLSTGDVDNINLVHHDIDVSLLVWQLTTNKNKLSYSATFGEPSIASQTLTITSESNQWSAQSDVDWLALDVTEGSGDATITVTPDISGFNSDGLYQGNITLTEVTTGDSKLIPVEIGLDNHYLFSSQSSLAFSQLANIDATSTTVNIGTNSPNAIAWQATSDVDWLTLTRTTNSNELLIGINKSKQFSQALNQAKITINAVDNALNIIDSVIAETINVSYYQSDEATKNHTITALPINNNAMVTSPSLPYVYIGEQHQLKVFHQYSGELLSTLAVAPENTLLEQFIIHPDGELLVAQAVETIVNDDETSSTVTHRYQINLTTFAVTEITDATIDYTPMRFVSFAGRHFIVTQALELADSNLQRVYWDQSQAFLSNQMDQAAITAALYALDPADSSFKRYSAKVNDFTSESVVLEQTHQYRPELLAEGQAVSQFIVDDNEAGIYAISPTSEWISFDGESFSDHGLLTQAENNTALTLAKSHNSRAHYARFDPVNGFVIDIYNQAQQLVNTVPTLGQQPNKVQLSQDDKRLLVNASNAEQLEMITLEQVKISAQSLAFSTTFGDSTIAEQQVSISGLSQQWQITSNSDWLVVTTSESDGEVLVNANIDPSKITGWGLFTATITVFDVTSNSSSVISVSLAVDEVRLFSHTPSLAFNQQLDKAYLSQSVDILSNSETTIPWQASTDAEWLTLSVDLVNNSLTVTADPSKLNNNGLFFANITLAPVTEGASMTGEITVSFSKGDFNSSDFSELVIENITPNSAGIALDPLRPRLYVAQGDAIDVYNIIDGTKLTSIASPLAGTDLTNLVVHPNGSMLLTSNVETYLDENEQTQTRTNYYQLDLTTETISQLASEDISIEFSPAEIVIIAGKAIVVTEALELADLSLQRQYWDNANAFIAPSLTGVTSSSALLAFNAGTSNLLHYSLQYNAFADTLVTINNSNTYVNSAFSNGISALATNKTGSNIYTVNAASEWSTFDGQIFSDQGKLDGNPLSAPVALITDNNDNSYFYRFDFTIGFFTLSKYDENQATIWVAAYSAGSTNVYLSAEYQRVIHYNSTAQQLVIDFMSE